MNHPIISVPSFDGNVHSGITRAILNSRKDGPKTYQFGSISLLPYCFNVMFAQALNRRKNGITHFAMLHADVVPEDLWLDKMLAIMEDKKADVLSAVIPIKSPDGMTSTAIESDDPWLPRRLNMAEVYERARTFTDPGLLVNSGLMLVDIRSAWVDRIFFRFEDKIQESDGEFKARVVSEDWLFSRDARKLGAKIYATTEVLVNHMVGVMAYSNGRPPR